MTTAPPRFWLETCCFARGGFDDFSAKAETGWIIYLSNIYIYIIIDRWTLEYFIVTILFGKSLGIADSRSLCLTTELKHFKDFGLGDPMRSKLRILDIMIFLVILEWIWWMLDAVSARQRCRISWAAVELWHRRFYMNWQATAVERLGRDSKTACRSNSFQKHMFFFVVI